jgi:chromosome segregation ATPase
LASLHTQLLNQQSTTHNWLSNADQRHATLLSETMTMKETLSQVVKDAHEMKAQWENERERFTKLQLDFISVAAAEQESRAEIQQLKQQMQHAGHVMFALSEHCQALEAKTKSNTHQRLLLEAFVRKQGGMWDGDGFKNACGMAQVQLKDMSKKVNHNQSTDLLASVGVKIKNQYGVDVVDTNRGAVNSPLFPTSVAAAASAAASSGHRL